MSKTLRMISTLAALAAVVALSAPSLAAKPSSGGGGTGGTSDIQLSGVYVPSGGQLKVAAASTEPALGDSVTFKTIIESLGSREYPLVGVQCFQDVNGNGLTLDPASPDLVYQDLSQPDAYFLLGAGWSQWKANGGNATCVATLYAYGMKGNTQTIRSLASRNFDATG
jgi:hypothetical protein